MDLDDLEDALREITEAIEDGRFEPSQWEEEFLESVREKIDAYLDAYEVQFESAPGGRDPLTESQAAKLREIWKKVEE